MENEIEKRAKSYIPDQLNPDTRSFTNKSVVSLCRDAYIKGADDIIAEYNGVSPKTVKELIETLRQTKEQFKHILTHDNFKSSTRSMLVNVERMLLSLNKS